MTMSSFDDCAIEDMFFVLRYMILVIVTINFLIKLNCTGLCLDRRVPRVEFFACQMSQFSIHVYRRGRSVTFKNILSVFDIFLCHYDRFSWTKPTTPGVVYKHPVCLANCLMMCWLRQNFMLIHTYGRLLTLQTLIHFLIILFFVASCG